MAIGTYAELKTAVANWLVRGDLTARIPEFVSLAESRLNRVLRARLAQIEAALTATPSARTIALPSAFAEPLNLWIERDTGRDVLRYIDPSLLETYEDVGEPRNWSIDGGNLAFERPCDQAYAFTLRYLGKYQLSDASPTNTLLTNYPDAYLFATLCEAAPFLRDAELSGAYEARLERAIKEINAKDARAPQTLSTEIAAVVGRNVRNGYSIYRDH